MVWKSALVLVAAVGFRGALGDRVVLPATAIGTPVGPFTAPASAATPAAHQIAKPEAAASTTHLGTPGGVFICENVEWADPCGYAVQPLDECILLANPWNLTVSSFGPDPGATCFAFASGNCDSGDAQWSFTYPGDDTGGLASSDPWNDLITSFACVAS